MLNIFDRGIYDKNLTLKEFLWRGKTIFSFLIQIAKIKEKTVLLMHCFVAFCRTLREIAPGLARLVSI